MLNMNQRQYIKLQKEHCLAKKKSLEKRYTFCGKITKINVFYSILGVKNTHVVFEKVALFSKNSSAIHLLF